jgi:hypothetical protein
MPFALELLGTTSAYCDASVSTPTSFQFLAALRTMAGPPMSMFSMASASVQPALATVASNGYRLTTSRSMVSMPWAFSAAMCSGSVAAGQQAAMHLGVQGLDAAVQHLGEAGDLGHLGHGQALRRPAAWRCRRWR